MTKRLLGSTVTNEIILKCRKECEELKSKGIKPQLAVLRVGENKSDISYETSIIKLMAKADISVKSVVLKEDISQEDFDNNLKVLNDNDKIHGILVFRPLPKQLDEDKIKYLINPNKDIDCFSPINLAKVFISDNSGFYPCTPLGVMEILDHYDIELEGKEVVLIGRSLVVGKPLSMMLLDRNATVTICHSKTKNLKEVCKKADVLIAAVGRGNMVNKDYIKPGAVVIDVGINFVDGKMCGDVDFESAYETAGRITPVPGGVGSVTTSCLMVNLIKACKMVK
ncbi:bifunctional 5,10-methylenetetrahydrofolate dehydrogenase/5,10-methenyltetrahydrofolate cyclohydrolase [Anaerofustis stercorihominis]|uniref:Bifunctional protein FolD n=2 Tax=Anaerofustis stercorihominis TaxID=214853 RepID=B1CAP1_9FIRM|nr:tetrahydrofolate dehydrogenase/cyclohydrolase catalytic domain-containing protein [Anaerofustis stercorihominis]EDS72514.1 tetrahydrofolate dehydrogenase/cyclohydrolase, NAD(P)-binding domain protein [Anaerofustis stercorihominis DSM 17244]MCQ4795249.1 bifunctional 5,10-methylene-tetrahydrofolate dehydrogenase/5,10-methylene-tetrahydrofolate cyclohydrolase [Anaerofustis stercorihominis]RGD73547.1 bifunctional 5,10-methylene-tetrahydrofolate dehydrogenase/5,10-methylene-tetrahydrofolate cycloh